jgi:hypothetical protein
MTCAHGQRARESTPVVLDLFMLHYICVTKIITYGVVGSARLQSMRTEDLVS